MARACRSVSLIALASLSMACSITGTRDLPGTVQQAADVATSWLDDDTRAEIAYLGRSDLVMLHFTLGLWIRNEMGLWSGNARLMKDCGTNHPDDCSGVILDRIWHQLRADLPAEERKALESMEEKLARIRPAPLKFENSPTAQVAESLNALFEEQLPAPDRPIVRVHPDAAADRITWSEEGDVEFTLVLGRLEANTSLTIRKAPPELILEPDLWPISDSIPKSARIDPFLVREDGYRKEMQGLVTNHAEWERAWKDLGPRRDLGDLPTVDFSTHVVVVASAGRKKGSGHTIELEAHGMRKGRAMFSVLYKAPGTLCAVRRGITYPTAVFIIPARLEGANFLFGFSGEQCWEESR